MATIVNNPPAEQPRDSGGSNSLLGVILIIIVIFLVFYYGLPYLQAGFSGGGTQINVPKQVDVNVNQQQPQK